MRRTGTLSVNNGISKLDDTRLAMAGGNNPFGDATNFLANRGLGNNEPIWVDGSDEVVGNVPAFFITDAGRAGT